MRGGTILESDASYLWPRPEIDAELLELPDESPCIGPEAVTPADVRWLVALRDENRPLMSIVAGTVTGYLPFGGPSYVEIESSSMRVRGVLGHGVRAVARQPMPAANLLLADGLDSQVIERREDGKLDVTAYLDAGITLKRVLPCSGVTLQRHERDGRQHLPSPLREVVVAQESEIQVDGKTYPLARFTPTSTSREPLGAVATLHRLPAARGRSWVSIRLCGGTLVGTVPSSALLGAPKDPLTLKHCVAVISEPAPSAPALERPLRCNTEQPLFLRQRSSLDRVGTLKPGATVQVNGSADAGRVFVTIADSPVQFGPAVCFELDESEVRRHCRPR